MQLLVVDLAAGVSLVEDFDGARPDPAPAPGEIGTFVLDLVRGVLLR